LDFGGYAEFVKCRAEGVAKIPNEWSFSEAASVGVQFATAYHVLYNTGPLIEGI
jgi:NADPH:quinone reductase-like Zn-dependent oxidoreductase